jgi:hypothetical protein
VEVLGDEGALVDFERPEHFRNISSDPREPGLEVQVVDDPGRPLFDERLEGSPGHQGEGYVSP